MFKTCIIYYNDLSLVEVIYVGGLQKQSFGNLHESTLKKTHTVVFTTQLS